MCEAINKQAYLSVNDRGNIIAIHRGVGRDCKGYFPPH